jgi:hypothetical protein
VSTVAYPSRRPAPGWWRTAGLLLAGLLLGSLALLALYSVGSLLGLISTNYGSSQRGVINEWPFLDNGWWSLAANLSAMILALLVVTVVTARMLRESFDSVSEGRLAIVLLFTGMLPLVTAPHEGSLLFGFLIATWLLRHWVVREDDRAPRRTLIVVAVALSLTIASYGLLHPVRVLSASPIAEHPAKAGKAISFSLYNGGRVPLTVEQISTGPIVARTVAGWPWQPHPVKGLRIGPGATQVFTLRLHQGGCATLLPDASVRYRLLGLKLDASLQIGAAGLPPCR